VTEKTVKGRRGRKTRGYGNKTRGFAKGNEEENGKEKPALMRTNVVGKRGENRPPTLRRGKKEANVG